MQQRLNHPHIPPLTDINLRIIAVFFISYLIETIARGVWGVQWSDLILRFDHSFQPVQLITHIFTYGPFGPFNALIHLFLESIMLWMFGSELESNWGSYNYLKIFYFGILGGVIVGAITSLFIPIYLYSFSGGLAAVMVSYAMIWPERKALFFFVIPIKMKWLILILFVILFIHDFPGQFIMQLGGALTAAFFIYYYARKGRNRNIGSGAPFRAPPDTNGPIEHIKERLRQKKLRKKQEEINQRINVKSEVDRLLEKISREGLKSLTSKEKRFLDRASKNF